MGFAKRDHPGPGGKKPNYGTVTHPFVFVCISLSCSLCPLKQFLKNPSPLWVLPSCYWARLLFESYRLVWGTACFCFYSYLNWKMQTEYYFRRHCKCKLQLFHIMNVYCFILAWVKEDTKGCNHWVYWYGIGFWRKKSSRILLCYAHIHPLFPALLLISPLTHTHTISYVCNEMY